MARQSGGCFTLHRVDWVQSFLASNGARMLCWYRAPDAESVRVALRQLGSDMSAVWAGTVAGDPAATPPLSQANVMAELSLDPARPTAMTTIDRLRSGACLRHGVALVRSFVSTSGTRAVCVFAAAGEDAVRAALRDAGLAAESVWRCEPLTPALS